MRGLRLLLAFLEATQQQPASMAASLAHFSSLPNQVVNANQLPHASRYIHTEVKRE